MAKCGRKPGKTGMIVPTKGELYEIVDSLQRDIKYKDENAEDIAMLAIGSLKSRSLKTLLHNMGTMCDWALQIIHPSLGPEEEKE